jgi:PAS domain S-box-containing protein
MAAALGSARAAGGWGYGIGPGGQVTIDLIRTFAGCPADGAAMMSAPNLPNPVNGQPAPDPSEALRRESELLQAIIDAIPVMITLYEPDTRVLRLNPEFRRVTGWTMADAAPVPLMERCYPDPAYREEVRQYMQTCAAGWKDIRMRTRDGRDVETAWANIRLSDGTQVGIGLDVGERRRAEQALERYRLLSQHARDIVVFVRTDGQIVEANDAAVAAYGYTHDELLAMRVFDLRDPATADLVPAQMLEADSRGITFETSHRRKDGTTFPVEVSSRGAEVGGERLLLSIIRDITERRRTDEALRESEAEFRTMFELAGVGAVQVDVATGRFLRVNRKQCEITGYRREELLRMTFTELTHPDDRARDLAEFGRMLRGEIGEESIEKRYVRKDGTVAWVHVTATLIRDEHGRPVRTVAVVQDVGERHRAEEALRRSEEMYRDLFENANDVIYALDMDQRFTSLNRRAEETFGYRREECLGMHAAKLVPPEHHPRMEEALRRKLAGEASPTVYEIEAVRKDGRRVPLEINSRLILRDGRPVGVQGIARDITERRQAEQALRESEERLRLALDAGRCGVWDWDIAGQKVTWSQRIYEFFGLGPGMFGGRLEDFQALIHPEDAARVSEAIRRAVEEGRPYTEEFRVVRPDGEVRWIATSGRVLYDAAGRPVRMLGATIDVTERRAAEEALREADRRKDEFLAMLAHELRNPLAPIRNATEVLRLIGPADPNLARARDLIGRQVTHMARLVDDLLDVSRISRGKILLRRQRLDLVPLVRAAVEDHRPLLERGGVRLSVEAPAGPLWVDGDATRLAQVVGNLLHNANKFTNTGGQVLVRLTAGPDATAVLAVRDTGIGMDAGMLTRLFEPFSQADRSLDRSRGGLGLGLALVKGLMELHGGTVRAASDGPGQGTEIILTLPLCPAPAGLTAASPAGQPVGARSLRVLVVEDSRDTAESLQMVLELAGHQVGVAHAGDEGVAMARQMRPDVVLCDIGLPGGMDGFAVARALRADPEQYAVTLIAISGYGQDEDQRRARQAGFDRHLTKPVDPAALKALLEALAGRER